MFIQGDLQNLFDALYKLGAIDPVLTMNWQEITDQMAAHPSQVKELFSAVNSCKGDQLQLLEQLKNLKPTQLHFIAMEVAREFVEFSDRNSLH